MIIEKVFMSFIKLLAYLVVFVFFFGLITIILSIAKDFLVLLMAMGYLIIRTFLKMGLYFVQKIRRLIKPKPQFQ